MLLGKLALINQISLSAVLVKREELLVVLSGNLRIANIFCSLGGRVCVTMWALLGLCFYFKGFVMRRCLFSVGFYKFNFQFFVWYPFGLNMGLTLIYMEVDGK